MLHEAQVDSAEAFYNVNPKGTITSTQKRKMAFQFFDLANKGKMLYVPKDLHTAAEHNPAMIFDEEGRLHRW